MKLKKLKNKWTHAHLLYYLMILCCVLVSIMILGSTISLLTGSEYIGVDDIRLATEHVKQNEMIKSDNIEISIPDTFDEDATVSVTPNNSLFPYLWFYLWDILTFILMGIVFFLFSKISKTIIDEVPFHEKNPKYLTGIGIILLLTPVLSWLFQLHMNAIVADINMPKGIHYVSDIHLDGKFTIFGLFVLALAYVFKEGTRLHKEQKLTV